MPLLPLTIDGPSRTVVLTTADFNPAGHAILIKDADESQLQTGSTECNVVYDLRVGARYQDHRDGAARELLDGGHIELLPGNSVIIETLEEVVFPSRLFGQIMPKVTLLQKGIANTPTKIDPGYSSPLLITAFNHGKLPEQIKRGERFCAMFIQTVAEGVRPYSKPGKRLRGAQQQRRWQRIRDLLEANIAAVTVVLLLVTAVNTLMLLFK
jgi:deoxycytidine triphosphate deaminase